MPPQSSATDGIHPAQDAAVLLSTLAALRSDGAHRLDPVRFRYLENLLSRHAMAQQPVQRMLLAKLGPAVAQYQARWARQANLVHTATVKTDVPPATGPVRPFASVYARRRAAANGAGLLTAAPQPAGEAPLSPLAALNRYIRQAARQAADGSVVSDGDAVAVQGEQANVAARHAQRTLGAGQRDALKSARRFSETWSKLQSAQLVEQALQRAPDNAGPFNPHMLMVRAMVTMRDLSPDCLHRFMQHADAMLKLEQVLAQFQAPPGKAKPVKSSRTRK